MCDNHEFIDSLYHITKESFVVICVGGGTQINEAFKKAGLDVGTHGPLGRETKSFRERQLARDILEENQARLQDRLAKERIVATVIIPVLDVGSVLCHVNGDQFVRTVYLGFDNLFIVTTPDRIEKKKLEFADLPKVQVMAFGTHNKNTTG
jgi:acetylglutamate kinase